MQSFVGTALVKLRRDLPFSALASRTCPQPFRSCDSLLCETPLCLFFCLLPTSEGHCVPQAYILTFSHGFQCCEFQFCIFSPGLLLHPRLIYPTNFSPSVLGGPVSIQSSRADPWVPDTPQIPPCLHQWTLLLELLKPRLLQSFLCPTFFSYPTSDPYLNPYSTFWLHLQNTLRIWSLVQPFLLPPPGPSHSCSSWLGCCSNLLTGLLLPLPLSVYLQHNSQNDHVKNQTSKIIKSLASLITKNR